MQTLKEKSTVDSDKDDDDDDDIQSINDKPLTAIAYNHPSADNGNKQISEIETETAMIKTSINTRVSTKAHGLINIVKGSALIFASKPTTVQCGAWQMTLEPNTIILVSKQNDTIKIRNIYQDKAASLRLSCESKHVSLESGQAIVVGPDEASVKESLGADNASTSQLKPLSMGNGQFAVTCDLCLESPLSSINSNVLPGDDNQSVAKRLYKKAAGAMLITYDH